MNKNLLILKGLNKDNFLKTHDIKEWDILDIKEFIQKFKNLRKVKYNCLVCGYQDLNDKNLQYPIQLFLLLLRANREYFIDNQGIIKNISFFKFIFWDTPFFILETIFDLIIIIFSWLTLLIFSLISQRLKKVNDNKKEIVYLRTDNFRGLQEGGSFTHFRVIVKGFKKLGYKVYYIGSGEIEVSKLDSPKTIISYPKKFNLPEISEIYYNWRFILKAYKIIKKEKPLFIYQRHSIFNVCGAILILLTKIPLVLEYNGSEPWIRQKWGGLLIFKKLCYFMEIFSLKKAKIIIVVSKPMKEELIKRNIPENKILVNYNGVDTEEFNPNIEGSEIRKKLNLEDKIIIGAVSTFGIWHGMPILAQAIKPLKEKLQVTSYKFHILFIGDGVQRPECERIIKETGMKNYVTFTGTIPYQEIPQYLAACDILVSPHVPNPDGTPFFGSPTKLFEYMAMGKGIVASNLDQIGEILEHKKTAWLVKPGDVNDLSDGINQLINDKNFRDNLGKNTYKEVKNKYIWEENVKKIIDCFLTKI